MTSLSSRTANRGDQKRTTQAPRPRVAMVTSDSSRRSSVESEAIARHRPLAGHDRRGSGDHRRARRRRPGEHHVELERQPVPQPERQPQSERFSERKRFPEPERVPVSSNAEGARRARDERGTAAIASRAAAEIYGLNILAEEIEDRSDNTTRFLVIGRKLFTPSGADRTTLLVSASGTDDPGALFRLLEPFAEHGINMTRIESRPSRKRKWDYVFFMDVEGHVSDQPLAQALASLEARASLFKVLGSYPRAVL